MNNDVCWKVAVVEYIHSRYAIEMRTSIERGPHGKGRRMLSLMKNSPFTVSGTRLSLGVGG